MPPELREEVRRGEKVLRGGGGEGVRKGHRVPSRLEPHRAYTNSLESTNGDRKERGNKLNRVRGL